MLGTCIMLIRSINISSSNMFLSFIASNFVTESIISVYVIANQFLGSCLMRQMVDLHSKSKYCGFYYRPPTKLWEVNVFIRVSLSTGSPMWPFPMMHLTLLYRTHPQSQSCPSRHGISGPPSDMGPQTSSSPSPGGYHWRPVQTSPLQDPLSWHLVVIEVTGMTGASGRYASYWNAFLFTFSFTFYSFLDQMQFPLNLKKRAELSSSYPLSRWK